MIDNAVVRLEKVVRDGMKAFSEGINLIGFRSRCDGLFQSFIVEKETNLGGLSCEGEDGGQGFETPIVVVQQDEENQDGGQGFQTPIGVVQQDEENRSVLIEKTVGCVERMKEINDFEVPSFHLLSQETEEQQQEKETKQDVEDSEDDDVVDGQPLVVVATEKNQEGRPKRKPKPTQELKSPFLNRQVQVKKGLVISEKKVARALFSMQKGLW